MQSVLVVSPSDVSIVISWYYRLRATKSIQDNLTSIYVWNTVEIVGQRYSFTYEDDWTRPVLHAALNTVVGANVHSLELELSVTRVETVSERVQAQVGSFQKLPTCAWTYMTNTKVKNANTWRHSGENLFKSALLWWVIVLASFICRM